MSPWERSLMRRYMSMTCLRHTMDKAPPGGYPPSAAHARRSPPPRMHARCPTDPTFAECAVACRGGRPLPDDSLAGDLGVPGASHRARVRASGHAGNVAPRRSPRRRGDAVARGGRSGCMSDARAGGDGASRVRAIRPHADRDGRTVFAQRDRHHAGVGARRTGASTGPARRRARAPGAAVGFWPPRLRLRAPRSTRSRRPSRVAA